MSCHMILDSNQFFYAAPTPSKNYAFFESGQKRLKNNRLPLLD